MNEVIESILNDETYVTNEEKAEALKKNLATVVIPKEKYNDLSNKLKNTETNYSILSSEYEEFKKSKMTDEEKVESERKQFELDKKANAILKSELAVEKLLLKNGIEINDDDTELKETISSIISKTSSRVPQDLSEVTYAYNIKREEEHIDFSKKSSREIFNQVRGLCPSPLANVVLFDQEMKVVKCYDYGKKYDNHLPGEIVEVIKEGMVISTIDGSVVFTEVKPFGKKAMSASSYLNGVDKNRLIGQVLQ